MIISHKYKFIFIKTRKTAGTSIEQYLSQFLGENDIITTPERYGLNPTMNPDGFYNFIYDIIHWTRVFLTTRKKSYLSNIFNGKYDTTMPAILVKSRVPHDVWDNYFKFCFEREPLSKSVSHFEYQKRKNFPESCDTFEEYLEAGYLCYNYPQYTDFNGNVIVDFIGRFERLEEDFSYVCDKLGIPKGELPKLNVGNYEKLPDYCNPQLRAVVEKAFTKETELV